MTRRVLVLGGTGFVGRAVCEHLARLGQTVRVPTRRLQHGRHLLPLPGVELVQADVHDDAALAGLLGGCDAVVHLVAILHGTPQAFQRVHVDLPTRLAAACRHAGVPRLVHVSALGVGPDAPSHYLRSKTAGEAALRSAGSALELTILRPSVIFGATDRFINLFAEMQAIAPLVPLAGAHARFQPVWVEDVAEAIVRSLQDRGTIGKVFEATGPTVYTLAELVRLAGRWSGHPRPVFPLHDALARVQAALMTLLPGPPLMSADNLDSMRVPNIASGQMPGLQALGLTPASLEAVMMPALGRGPGRGRFDQFRSQTWRE